MRRIMATQPPDRLCAAFAALSRSDGIIVGPNWIDIATPGELARQLRCQRVTALTQGVYVATHGDPLAMRWTLSAFNRPRCAAIHRRVGHVGLPPPERLALDWSSRPRGPSFQRLVLSQASDFFRMPCYHYHTKSFKMNSQSACARGLTRLALRFSFLSSNVMCIGISEWSVR